MVGEGWAGPPEVFGATAGRSVYLPHLRSIRSRAMAGASSPALTTIEHFRRNDHSDLFVQG